MRFKLFNTPGEKLHSTLCIALADAIIGLWQNLQKPFPPDVFAAIGPGRNGRLEKRVHHQRRDAVAGQRYDGPAI